MRGEVSSPGWIRTNDQPINSRVTKPADRLNSQAFRARHRVGYTSGYTAPATGPLTASHLHRVASFRHSILGPRCPLHL
jgi:hypothetical protein